jgi:flagellar motor component MotA
MFKGIAGLLFGGFLVLGFFLHEFSEGPAFYPLLTAAMISGWISIALMTFPEGFQERIWKPIHNELPQASGRLVQQMEALSKTVREEGLLALESRKKEFTDPNLRIYLKRIVEGFEAKDLLPMIRNQQRLREGLFQEAERSVTRYLSFLPTLGLLLSLMLISRGSGSGGSGYLFRGFVPFLSALALQTVLEALLIRWLQDGREECGRYFSVLEEGVEGIQQGHHPELLADRMRARISSTVRRVES